MRRNTLFAVIAAAGVAASLSGCFPIVAGGVGVGAMMADDRRTSGIYIEDERIEIRVQADIGKLGDKVHVNATSFNRVVLLAGEVPEGKFSPVMLDCVTPLVPVIVVAAAAILCHE
jgi:osmotically-inducible protein OsmY